MPVFTAEGQSDTEAKANPPLNLEEIHPRYFSTFQVPLMRGRAFTAADSDTAPPVAIVSADVAPAAWPGLDPIGRRLKMGLPASRGRWLTVVGITAPTRYRDLPIRAFDAVPAGVADDRGGRATGGADVDADARS